MSRLFDAGTEKVDFGAITDQSTMTCFAWIYPTASIVSSQHIIGCNDNPSTNFWMLRCQGTNQVVVKMSASTSDGDSTSANGTITTNAWQFVAGVITPTTIEVYRGTTPDNIVSVESTSTNPSGTHTDSAEVLTVGNTEDDNQPFAGKIDNTGYVNSALTLQELKAIAWQSSRARNDFALYSPLWGIHSSEIDLSGNGLTGTVTGATRDTGSPSGLFNKLRSFIPAEDEVIGVVDSDRSWLTNNIFWGNV